MDLVFQHALLLPAGRLHIAGDSQGEGRRALKERGSVVGCGPKAAQPPNAKIAQPDRIQPHRHSARIALAGACPPGTSSLAGPGQVRRLVKAFVMFAVTRMIWRPLRPVDDVSPWLPARHTLCDSGNQGPLSKPSPNILRGIKQSIMIQRFEGPKIGTKARLIGILQVVLEVRLSHGRAGRGVGVSRAGGHNLCSPPSFSGPAKDVRSSQRGPKLRLREKLLLTITLAVAAAFVAAVAHCRLIGSDLLFLVQPWFSTQQG